MKYLVFILSVYLFALNFIGCRDAVAMNSETEINISQMADEHQEGDTCSLFCTCQCCQISVTPLRLMKTTLSHVYNLKALKLYSFYQNGNESDFITSFFKPPIA